MKGINLEKPITYLHSSLRYFNKNERHVTRICKDDVLVLVFEGVLRFSEDGICHEIKSGEYYIQQKNLFQYGYAESDSPKYLYVHFNGEWTESGSVLPCKGNYNIDKLMDKMKEMDTLSHGEYSYIKRCEKFYEILCSLDKKTSKLNTANKIAMFIESKNGKISLEEICNKFNFTKNHIINIFKKEYGTTPVKYINNVKLKHAKYLLEVTSHTTEVVAEQSGFNDYSHFYKLFSREIGTSPTEWRKQKR